MHETDVSVLTSPAVGMMFYAIVLASTNKILASTNSKLGLLSSA